MCNSIDSDNDKASDGRYDHDYAYASDNDNNKTRREMTMLKCQGSSSRQTQACECCEQQTCCPHKQKWGHSRSRPSFSACYGGHGMFQCHSSLQQTLLQKRLIPQLADAWRTTQLEPCSII
jgi:hypothetical protein